MADFNDESSDYEDEATVVRVKKTLRFSMHALKSSLSQREYRAVYDIVLLRFCFVIMVAILNK